ncbi:thiamine pyrophosphate-dependent dehydrogenase E1 component subunit alpha [Paracoccus sp. P2]|uniref:Thiamine pyrophosphate-dependent dehydrogenase E1 component subunit alpha n=1 Tax=Paracoccus pantotrophus TaxID=82367 RepID=A0A7H9BZ68_PARPN|nr:thiamine pyrophosphate-dependent dehydrogenase E1 component subunit alpha [Paracoccus pantotrophus]MDF3853860.1 thiamine pyrophosphate-dependent dehydrogenase E1 component subunit alpha [Paracoccus pantotrophus]QLH16704.1 thiamine pyrophosphate-dependent dehydrogenase E1 component subunit alpha [Paracoccus pantotrophus]RNI15184.1 thiamine pyrophosphate-dependent dehydrogenase E1 component subunit alpha [Paracoccus pantotrophus]SFO56331.1 pyruvate dehydrogenase E1 component alpha subunit [Par
MQQSRTDILKAYRQMRMIRDFEERLHIENRSGEIAGFTHLYAGQEAIAVGICEHLTDRDYISSTHRGHGHCIAKGCDPRLMMHEIYGRADGLCKGRGGSMHIADIDKGMLGANGIVGGGPPIAVGAALACQARGDGSVAVSFGGGGSSNQGTVFEAMNMAVVLKLPKIFVFELNGYSEHTGEGYGIGSDLAGRTRGFGLPVFEADGFDYFSVHQAMADALEHVRAGKGPCALIAEATRYFGHFEGDPQNYRAKDEVKTLRETRDALLRFRRKVTEAKLIEAGELDAIDAEIAAFIEDCVASARKAPAPGAEIMLSDVYADY